MKKRLKYMNNREYEASLISQITTLENDLWRLQAEYQRLLQKYTKLVIEIEKGA